MSLTVIVPLIFIAIIIGVIIGYVLLLKIDIRHEEEEGKTLNIVWLDRKRPIFGLPCSFERYSFSDERIFVSKGLFSTKEDELRLYRVLDLSVKRTFWQKLFNVGDIIISSSDKTLGNFSFSSIKKPKEVKEKLSVLVEKNREAKRVTSREFLSDNDEDLDEDNN